jgi:16S rRNA (uracil1498-N3)-methyltransferase
VGAEVFLSDGDSNHARRVLRLQIGDECEVVLGKAVYTASVNGVDERVRVVLTERLESPAAGALYHSRVGLVQFLNRAMLFDQVVEKGTEVGASFFIFVPVDGSPRTSIAASRRRLDRWRRIAIEAAKQSKQVVVPSVESMDSIEQALVSLESQAALSVMLDPAATASLEEKLGPSMRAGSTIALWVGPESGWSPAQSECLKARGVEAGRLCKSVLRAETAGPVAVAVARLSIGDW